MIPNEVKQLVKGMYGKTTVPIKDEIVKKIIGNDERITCRPADLIAPELEANRKAISQYLEQDEDVLTYALFPQQAEKFFQYRNAQKLRIDAALIDDANKVYPV